ncbi:hypothetical protein TSAR_005276 [Trichomalopsis sarcophagae]|uniref:DDE Tnp4 domain-containing protein n=1 Tax=Trichomalopsis sarcophagae TaxID=543379 RepID=A0A232F2W0_9HYME|nr:hypothetical protein TSAR_005276 [Trichomalopsis sarcophagae]
MEDNNDDFVRNIINEAQELINRFIFRRSTILKKYLRDTSNPFLMPADIFMRMPSHVVMILIDLLQDRMLHERHSIPIHLVVLSMLSFQKGYSNDYGHPMGQATASRYLDSFLQAILQLTPQFIQFPTSQRERQQISAQFRRTIRIPGLMVLYGYARSSTLLTPILDAPERTPAYVYTEEHVHTRCKVEQTIGILTNTWKVISRSRKLYYKPRKVWMLINAAAILHNFRLMHGGPFDIRNNNIHMNNDVNNNIQLQFPNGQEEIDGSNKNKSELHIYFLYFIFLLHPIVLQLLLFFRGLVSAIWFTPHSPTLQSKRSIITKFMTVAVRAMTFASRYLWECDSDKTFYKVQPGKMALSPFHLQVLSTRAHDKRKDYLTFLERDDDKASILAPSQKPAYAHMGAALEKFVAALSHGIPLGNRTALIACHFNRPPAGYTT